MAWDFSTEPEFQEQLDWMREFVREEIWPLETIVGELDQGGARPHLRAAPGAGQGARPVGRAPRPRARRPGIRPAQARADARDPRHLAVRARTRSAARRPTPGNSEILAIAGTPEQKDRFLHPLLAGDLKSAFSMTEPNTAGSDPTQLQTRAVRDGDDYVIDGRKWFSSNGSIADFLIVMAVTDPEARPHQRATMFIVPTDTPGVNILRDVPTMEHPQEEFGKLGGHAEIVYDDVRVPAANRLGAEGEGFLISQQRLYPGRIHHCMRWIGVAGRAFDMLCERATYRFAHGSVLGEHQTVQNWIADSAAQIQAARLMTLHAAWVMDTQGIAAARQEISLIKFYGADVLHDVIDRAVQVHGALGYSTDLPLEAMYRYARAWRLYDGPDEVHRQSVARQILRGYSPPPDEVPSEHVPTRRAAAREKFAEILEAVTAND